MNERERRKEELLNDWPRDTRMSSDTLKNLAMRIQSAAEESQDNTRIHEDQNQDLRTNIDANQGPLPFHTSNFLNFHLLRNLKNIRRCQLSPAPK